MRRLSQRTALCYNIVNLFEKQKGCIKMAALTTASFAFVLYIGLIVLMFYIFYLVIKAAVRNAIIEARAKIKNDE